MLLLYPQTYEHSNLGIRRDLASSTRTYSFPLFTFWRCGNVGSAEAISEVSKLDAVVMSWCKAVLKLCHWSWAEYWYHGDNRQCRHCSALLYICGILTLKDLD